MSVLLELSMFPLDRGTSLSVDVAPLVALIRDSGVPYRLTAMGTIVETESLEQALDLVARCHARLRDDGCERIYAAVTIDSRSGPAGRLTGKVESVAARLGAAPT